MAHINRRDFFKGLGAGVLLLHPMLAMIARAQSTGPKAKRFIYMFSANGTILENWYPQGTSTPGSLRLANSQILSPLTPYQAKINVLQGVHNNIGGPGDDHVRGCLSSLTAMPNNTGAVYTVNSSTGYNSGQSIDQYIAKQAGLKSIVAGAQSNSVGSGGFFSLLSSEGSNKPVNPVMDPKLLHSNLFSGVSAGTAPSLSETDANNVKNKSILDFATKDMARLRARLPADLSSKLSDHADAIRDLESKISTPPPAPMASCTIPTVGNSSAYTGNSNYPAAIDMHMKNIVYAMACGISNSAVLICGGGVDLHVHNWLGIPEEHHTISHLTDGTAKIKLTQINNWYAARFKELLDLLNGVPEVGGGTMLDSSLVVWGNELSAGANHSHQNLPFVLAGGAGGKLPGGRYITAANRGHGELLVSFGQAMGYSLTQFGNATQPLSGLLI